MENKNIHAFVVPENMEALRTLILDDIINLIQENQDAGNITLSDANRLRSLIRKLYNHLYAHYDEFIEGGFNDMMEDGLVLDVDIIEAELTKKITERITKEVTEQVTLQVTDQVTQRVTKQVTQQVTDQITQQVTDQVTQQVTQQVTKQVTQQVTKQVTQQVTEQVTRQNQINIIRKLYSKLGDASKVTELLDISADTVKEAI